MNDILENSSKYSCNHHLSHNIFSINIETRTQSIIRQVSSVGKRHLNLTQFNKLPILDYLIMVFLIKLY